VQKTNPIWSPQVEKSFVSLLQLAISEDIATGDITTDSLVPPEVEGTAKFVSREVGVVAGIPAIEKTFRELCPSTKVKALISDGERIEPGTVIAEVTGPVRSLLTGERTALNFLGRLSGIASLTNQYADLIHGTKAKVYDTRKTTPGWRYLEKYAVSAGGGENHRIGLFDAVLIKDNHLAFGDKTSGLNSFSPSEAVAKTRELTPAGTIIQIEVDTLEQFEQLADAAPDIVLLDNMSPEQLKKAVAFRDKKYPQIELEASGGINSKTIRTIAETGVDRISVGAITHSATCLDIGLDWY
jgi:nicotinate-nucleotide pyrophosphorylase (carboxylating)